jgi:hypothetical protein
VSVIDKSPMFQRPSPPSSSEDIISPTFRRPAPLPSSGDIIPLMMEAEMVSETLGFYPQLTQLVTQEHFIEFSNCESFKSYKKYCTLEV